MAYANLLIWLAAANDVLWLFRLPVHSVAMAGQKKVYGKAS